MGVLWSEELGMGCWCEGEKREGVGRGRGVGGVCVCELVLSWERMPQSWWTDHGKSMRNWPNRFARVLPLPLCLLLMFVLCFSFSLMDA